MAIVRGIFDDIFRWHKNKIPQFVRKIIAIFAKMSMLCSQEKKIQKCHRFLCTKIANKSQHFLSVKNIHDLFLSSQKENIAIFSPNNCVFFTKISMIFSQTKMPASKKYRKYREISLFLYLPKFEYWHMLTIQSNYKFYCLSRTLKNVLRTMT